MEHGFLRLRFRDTLTEEGNVIFRSLLACEREFE